MKAVLPGLLMYLQSALAAVGGFAAGPDLQFPGVREAVYLRLAIHVDGRSPEAAWEAFLDRWFDSYDRSGDGLLSAEEAARVFPLPLVAGREAAMNFAQLDADSDGSGSRAEFKSFYRRTGFTPVAVTIVPPSADCLRTSEALFRQLDRDNNGVLAKVELEQSSAVLRRLDQDEDDLLTVTELLFTSPDSGSLQPSAESLPTPEDTPLALASKGARPDAVLNLVLGKEQQPPALEATRDSAVPLALRRGGQVRLQVADSFCTVHPASAEKRASFRAARNSYIAQFKAAFEEGASVEKKQLEQDPELQTLAGMFEHADGDANGYLSLEALVNFLTLIEEGVACQTAVTIVDRGRNLFDSLDLNQDDRLDFRELNAAIQSLSGNGGHATLTRKQVPRQFRLTVEQGTPGATFGPVPVPRQFKRSAPIPAASSPGPAWFEAMDRDGDGFIAPWEFLGSPKLFHEFDTDGDGSIGSEEAQHAGQAGVASG